MIVNITRGDVFQSPHRYIVFAVNTEGYNDAGFAGAVSSRYWPDLANIENKLGTVLRHNAGDKTFWALVCHSLGVNGWKQTDETVMRCLDKIEVADSETIAIVLMGAGMVGQMGGGCFLNSRWHGPIEEKSRGLYTVIALNQHGLMRCSAKVERLFLFSQNN